MPRKHQAHPPGTHSEVTHARGLGGIDPLCFPLAVSRAQGTETVRVAVAKSTPQATDKAQKREVEAWGDAETTVERCLQP